MEPAVKVLQNAQSHQILSKEASLTKDELRRRKDQSQKRPRVHEKIQKLF